MGEYAEQYTMETYGVDISKSEKKKVTCEWACPICGKKLFSKIAQVQHISMKHKKLWSD